MLFQSPMKKHCMTMPSKHASKGIACDQLATHLLSQSDNNLLVQQQLVEMHDIESGIYQLSEMNPCVRMVAGLDVHLKNDLKHDCGNKKSVLKKPKQPTTTRRDYTMEECTLTMDKLTAEEVSIQTGFENIQDLLIYVAIVCNGSFDKCMQQMSYLGWLEEWFFFFEMMYG